MPKLIDLAGQRFGRLVVLERVKNKGKSTAWKCKCDCGNYTISTTGSLRSGQKNSCGCLQREKIGKLNKGKRKSEDLTEQRFEMLVAKRQIGLIKGKALWECECDCGNIVSIPATYLKRGIAYSCGCKKRLAKNAEDLTGKRFGKLTVIGLGEDLIIPSGTRVRRWKCRCDCGNETLVTRASLIKGETKGCGCLIGKTQGKRRNNSYKIVGDYAYITIGGTEEKAICDKDMVDEFSKYYWYMDRRGYVCTRSNKTRLKMHRVVMNKDDNKSEVIDHINRNKLDNRRENLRLTTYSMNMFNKDKLKSKSGVTGVYKFGNKWKCTIIVDKKSIYLGCYDTIEEAKIARERAEIKYRGELKNKQ